MGQPDRVAALDRLLELTVVLHGDMTGSLAARGLTPARAHLLWVLAGSGPVTQRVLADALDVSPRTVTGLLDALAAGGFVVRRAHPHDRRAFLVDLTEPGRAAVERMQREQVQLADALFTDLPQARLDGLVRGLDHVLARLRELLQEGAAGA